MEQFRTYSPEDIILSNLDETADRQALLFEQELAHIAEFAREWMQSRPQDEELLSSLSDIGIDASKLHPDEHPAHCKKLLENTFMMLGVLTLSNMTSPTVRLPKSIHLDIVVIITILKQPCIVLTQDITQVQLADS